MTIILTSQILVREDGFEPPLFTQREQIYSLLQHHHRCRSRMILVLLTHYLLCSTELAAALTVYVHSYSGMIKPMAYISKTNTTFNYTRMISNNHHPMVNHAIV